MLISKEQFISFANDLRICHREQDSFHNDLRKYFDSPVCNYLQSAINTIEDMLVVMAECQDEDDIFSWWIHECDKDNHILTVKDTSTGNETEYDVLTPEGLYNYLYDMYHHDD